MQAQNSLTEMHPYLPSPDSDGCDQPSFWRVDGEWRLVPCGADRDNPIHPVRETLGGQLVDASLLIVMILMIVAAVTIAILPIVF